MTTIVTVKYPTDDKKYECITGTFEGFFVSSVEFCNHVKFYNDRKDHTRDNKIWSHQAQAGARKEFRVYKVL